MIFECTNSDGSKITESFIGGFWFNRKTSKFVIGYRFDDVSGCRKLYVGEDQKVSIRDDSGKLVFTLY